MTSNAWEFTSTTENPMDKSWLRIVQPNKGRFGFAKFPDAGFVPFRHEQRSPGLFRASLTKATLRRNGRGSR